MKNYLLNAYKLYLKWAKTMNNWQEKILDQARDDNRRIKIYFFD